MSTINDLTELTAVASGDLIYVEDISASTSKKATVANIADAIAASLDDSSVTTRALVNPYKFSAYLTSAFSTAGSGFYKLTCNVEDYDTGSNYDNVTNFRFTAPLAGFYHFDAAFLSAAIGVSRRIQIAIYKNGTLYANGTDDTRSADYTGGQLSIDMQLALSDYTEIYIFTSGSQAFDNTSGHACRFSGRLISTT